jgi:hypothetical protein
MELLRGIRHLLHREGYTIKGVQKILKEQGVDAVKVHGKDDNTLPQAQSVRPGTLPKDRNVGASGRASPAAPGDGRRALLRKAIAELEAMRVLLGARPRDSAKPVQRSLSSGS